MEKILDYLDIVDIIAKHYIDGKKQPKEIILPMDMYIVTIGQIHECFRFVNPDEKRNHFLMRGIKIIEGDNYYKIKVVL